MATYCVTIEDSGEQFSCSEGCSVLRAMASTGRKGIPVGCHGGGCGVCKVQIIEGRYQTTRMSREHISEDEERAQIVLACRVSPRSDVRLRVVGKLKNSLLERGDTARD